MLLLNDRVDGQEKILFLYRKKISLVFVKNILLESLLASSLKWPDELMPILAANPHGHFHDMTLKFKPSGIDYLLTRFSGGFKEASLRRPE